MRHLLGIGVLLVLLPALVQGCAPRPETEPEPPGPSGPAPGEAGVTPAPVPLPEDLPEEIEPDRAWTLVYGAGLPLDLNNPNLRGNGWNEATSLIYSRLYQIGVGGEVEPDLVERHWIEDDGLTWRIRLRRGVTWHDGSPFTIRDVQATLDRVLDPEGGSDLGLNLPMIASVEYPGMDTFVVHLHHPFPLLPVPLAEIAILPAGDPEGKTLNGTGPYRYARHRAGGMLELHAHLPYHLGRPSIPRILLVEIADDQARARAVAEGRIDFAHVKAQHTARIRRRSNTWVARMETGAWRGMPLNLRRPHLKDPRVRQAIDLALDRGQIVVNALPGAGRPAYQPLPPVSWAFSSQLDDAYFDPNKAVSLLEEAGWFKGDDGLRYFGRSPKVEVAGVLPASRRMDPAGRGDSRVETVRVPARSETRFVPAPARVSSAAPDGLQDSAGHARPMDASGVVVASTHRPPPDQKDVCGTWRSGDRLPCEDAEGGVPGATRRAASDQDDGGSGDETAEPLTLRLIIWKDEAFRLRAGQMVRAQLRRVGIRVELELVDNATYGRLAEKMGDDYDGFIGGWSALHDPGDNLYKKFHSRGSQNYMGYANPAVDRMLEEARAEPDRQAARVQYALIMEILRREAVFLPLAYPDYLFAARTRVAGFHEGVADSWYEYSRHAWRWRLIQD